MDKNLVYSMCECGGTQVSEWKAKEFTELKYCLKCGTFEERFPEEYPNEYVLTREQEGLTFVTLHKGGGYGSARLVNDEGATHDIFLFNDEDAAFELKEMIEESGLELDLHQSFVYAYDPDLGRGEVLYGGVNPEQYEDLYGDGCPSHTQVRVHAIRD